MRRMREGGDQFGGGHLRRLAERERQIPRGLGRGVGGSGPSELPEAADAGFLILHVAVLPVADVKPKAVRREGDANRAKILGLFVKQLLAHKTTERAAVTLNPRANDLALAKVGQEEIPAKIDGQGVFVVS